MENMTPFSKRIFDLIFSVIVLLVFSPIILIVAVVLVLIDGFPIFFRHVRPGKNGKPFKLIKFRSMRVAKDKNGYDLPDAERITKFGNFIRRTSVDELPEFFNILRGDMSVVGPRPLLMQYLDHYSKEQFRRHSVLPGVTGWAQINGRNAISWDEKFAFDLWYIDNWSFWLDLKIIILTIWKVIKGEDISQPGRATMDEFVGKSEE
jgi:lipopolysaccharide/colanic/teichoic acid biosynthesis glycosyltransferase